MESKIKFEKVSDISNRYAFLEVFINDNPVSIMDVIITDNQELCMKIYSNTGDIILTFEQWKVIMEEAQIFLQEEIINEKFFEDFMNSPESLE